MFISWAYNIYIYSTTPLLDFKQQCNVQPQIKEHVRFRKFCSLHVLTRRKRSENAQCPNLAYAEYLMNGRRWLGQRPHDHLDVSVSESIVSTYRATGSWRAFCNRCDSGGLKLRNIVEGRTASWSERLTGNFLYFYLEYCIFSWIQFLSKNLDIFKQNKDWLFKRRCPVFMFCCSVYRVLLSRFSL